MCDTDPDRCDWIVTQTPSSEAIRLSILAYEWLICTYNCAIDTKWRNWREIVKADFETEIVFTKSSQSFTCSIINDDSPSCWLSSPSNPSQWSDSSSSPPSSQWLYWLCPGQRGQVSSPLWQLPAQRVHHGGEPLFNLQFHPILPYFLLSHPIPFFPNQYRVSTISS